MRRNRGKPNQQISLEELGKRDLRVTAIHEAGHAVICEHFGIPWKLNRFEAKRATWDEKGAVGQLAVWRDTSRFRFAMIGWAGLLASERFIDSETNAAPDWECIMHQCYNDYEDARELGGDLCDISPADQEEIENTPFRWRACKTAARILEREWKRVEELAQEFLSTLPSV